VVTRSVKVFLEVVGTLVAGLIIITAAAAWRLSSGPISLDFLTPYIEQALVAPDGSYRAKLDRTVLAWAGWKRPVDLRVRGVHVLGAKGQVLANLPEVAIKLSARALLRGVVAPTSLEIFGARVHLRRLADGKLDLELGDQTASSGQAPIGSLLIQDLLGPVDPNRPISYLRRIRITRADLVIEDSHWDTSWKAQLGYLTLARSRDGIQADAALDLLADGATAHLSASGDYEAALRRMTLQLTFGDLEPAAFARAAPQLASLARVALPLGGAITAKLGPDWSLDQLRFEINGGAGTISLPELYPAAVAVQGVGIKGALTDHGSKLALDQATIDLGGAKLALAGTAQDLDGSSTLALGISLRDFKVDELSQRWPQNVAPNPRAWITTNLSGGMVEEMHATIAMHGRGFDPGTLAVDRLAGTMRVSGVDVHYLGKMPKVRGVDGNIVFDDKSLNISVNKGTVEGLTLDQGTIAITGLDGDDHQIAIEVVVRGPLHDAVQLIEHDPLGYASALGIDPKTMAGNIAVRAQLKFPLLQDLRFAQIQVAAAANMKDVDMADVFMGHDLSHGDLMLRINKAGMQISGTGTLGPAPISLDWNETFGKSGERRIEVKGELDDAARSAFGLDTGGLVAGPVPIDLHLRTADRRSEQVDLDLDLTKAGLTLPRVDWHKAPGTAGKAHLALLLSGGKLTEIRDFSVEAGDLAARGRMSFEPGDGRFHAVTLSKLDFGRNRLEGEVTHRPDGVYQISLKGGGLDIAPFLNAKQPPNVPETPGPKLAISLDVAKLWLTDSVDVPLLDASGTLDHDGEKITRLVVAAKTLSGASFNAQIVPSGATRALTVESENAGDVAKVLNVSDNVKGGKLKLTGTFDDSKPAVPLKGVLRIDNYQILNAPFLARLLTLASLTGIVDQLGGQGIAFSSLIAPFVKTGGKVEIREGRTAGSALGLTFEGALDFDANTVNVNGTIVPVYTLNSLLGNIPILGNILVGPKGGGVFAATYQATGSLDKPDVSVNPLSALAPGILRGFLDIFTGGSGNSSMNPPPDNTETPPGLRN
jgi:hypothetical protein